jgi:hypothetical protein
LKPVQVYRRRWYPQIQAALFLLLALVGLDVAFLGVSVGEQVFGVIFCALLATGAVRLARSGTVIVRPDSLEIRTPWRTYRVLFDQIESVTSEIRSVGPMAYRRCCLVIDRLAADRKVYTDFNSPPGRADHPAVVETVARSLDQLVRSHRANRVVVPGEVVDGLS